MSNIAEVIEIYNQYSYLLSEKQKIQEWVEGEKHTREEYKKQF